MRIIRTLGIVFLTGSCFQVMCQSVTPAQQVPQTVTYEALFRRILFLEDVASKLELRGTSGAAAQSKTQMSLGLTNQEATALTTIAKDWQTQCAAIQNAANLVPQAARNQAPVAGPPSAGVLEQLRDLQDRRDHLNAGQIAQLSAALGKTRFEQVDLLVRSTSTVRQLTIPPQSKQLVK